MFTILCLDVQVNIFGKLCICRYVIKLFQVWEQNIVDYIDKDLQKIYFSYEATKCIVVKIMYIYLTKEDRL